MTGVPWHVTGDMWHVTHDTLHISHSVGWTFCQNFSSLALPVWDWQCLEDIWTKGSLNQCISQCSDGGDCRIAPATSGLLTMWSAPFWLCKATALEHFWDCSPVMSQVSSLGKTGTGGGGRSWQTPLMLESIRR